jgi:hypothetical protein
LTAKKAAEEPQTVSAAFIFLWLSPGQRAAVLPVYFFVFKEPFFVLPEFRFFHRHEFCSFFILFSRNGIAEVRQ